MSKLKNSDKKLITENNSEGMFKALGNEDVNAFKVMFCNKDKEAWTFKNKEGWTVLHVSAYNSFTSIAIIILEYMQKRQEKDDISEFVNKQNSDGYNALHYASMKGNVDMIKLLLDNGADKKILNNNGMNVVHLAAQGNMSSSLIYFTETQNLNYLEKDNNGSTPLHWACFDDNINSFKFLISLDNIDLNVQDKEGFTPLHLSVMSEHTRIIKKLLRLGANKEIKDKKGRTPLNFAIEKRKNIAINMLMEDDSSSCMSFSNKLPLKKVKPNNAYTLLFLLFLILFEVSTFLLLLPGKYR